MGSHDKSKDGTLSTRVFCFAKDLPAYGQRHRHRLRLLHPLAPTGHSSTYGIRRDSIDDNHQHM